MHALEDVHETPWNSAPIRPGGSGVGWIVQFVPFHPSASASVPAAVPSRLVLPTAMHAVSAAHDTL